MKGDYTQFHSWLESVRKQTKHFSEVIDNEIDSGSLYTAMNVIKSGVYSPNTKIVSKTLTLLKEFSYEFQGLGMQAPAWEWFIGEDGGLEGCIYVMKKHNSMDVHIGNLFC